MARSHSTCRPLSGFRLLRQVTLGTTQGSGQRTDVHMACDRTEVITLGL